MLYEVITILWFCWFGFNGGSTVNAEGDASLDAMGHIFMTTNLAAAVSTLTVMIITWIRYKKPDISMTLNGTLAGLVAITAGCDAVSPVGSFFIGLIARITSYNVCYTKLLRCKQYNQLPALVILP